MSTINGKIKILVGKDVNNNFIYKYLNPTTVTSQISDFTSATNTLITTKLADYTTTAALENNFLGKNDTAIAAATLANPRTINISDNDATNTAEGTSFNGSANITLKLPSTIKANVTGTATNATNDNLGNQIDTTYATKSEMKNYIKSITITNSGVNFIDGNDNIIATITIMDNE